jgi:predicted dehydrogenase
MNKMKILVVGAGNMGASHAQAYHNMPEFEICGIVTRGESKVKLNEKLGNGYPLFDDYYEALKNTKPDAVSISTYPDTHEAYAIAALEADCHVFIEKPLADTVAGAEKEEIGGGLYLTSSSFLGEIRGHRQNYG